MKDKIKKIFSEKTNIIIAIIVLVIILIIVIVKIIYSNRNKVKADDIYAVFPAEVRDLYANMVNVSCNGDLHFDVDLGKTSVSDIRRENLLDYLFSNLDKNKLLSDKMNVNDLRKRANDLFMINTEFIDNIKGYQYGDYVYSAKDGKVIRAKNECVSDIKYVTHLYGYFYDEKGLSIDVSVAYLRDGMLYDFDNNEIGEYDGRLSSLLGLLEGNPYYRLYYIKRGGKFKLDSVEFKTIN